RTRPVTGTEVRAEGIAMRDGDRKRRKRKRALGFETLESMTLLSGVWVPGVSGSAPLVAPAATGSSTGMGSVQADASKPVAVNGPVRGVASFDRTLPDAGTTYTLGTIGRFSGLGHAVVSGTLHSVGFIAQGQATGALTLYAHQGSLSLQLTGPTQP